MKIVYNTWFPFGNYHTLNFFYLWYGVEYLLIRLFHKKQNCAYHDISLEEEAHNNDENPDYLKTRKHYAWWKYIRLRSNHK